MLSDKEIRNGLKRAEVATARPWTWRSPRGDDRLLPIVQQAKLWTFEVLTQEDASFICYAANHYESALRELLVLRQKVRGLEEVLSSVKHVMMCVSIFAGKEQDVPTTVDAAWKALRNQAFEAYEKLQKVQELEGKGK